jgi:hemerythrin-like domain-containing protein
MARTDVVQAELAGDLVRIHSVITRSLNVVIERSKAFAEAGYPDAATQKGFITYARCLLTMLHAHHSTENQLMFPYFRKKLPDAPYDQLLAQHREMEPIMKEVDAVISRVDGTMEPRSALGVLAVVLGRMRDIWQPHIQVEEEHFSADRIGSVLDMNERIRLGKELSEHARKQQSDPALMVPFILFNMKPGDRAVMSQLMPWVLTRVLVPIVWKRKWKQMQPFLL